MTADEVIGELDWAPLGYALAEVGNATVRFTNTTNGVVVEILSPDNPHCCTCQCNKLNPKVLKPSNPQSKSWHVHAQDGP